MQNRKRDTDVQNRLLFFWEGSIRELCVVYSKQIVNVYMTHKKSNKQEHL